ncbi:MAG: CRP/FNR family cyclic AMP-dependent transcriptional regulator [Bacteroidia bacterium]|jgi:CRP/FNR family cyclic AMP-dependent transcriptional regulator
MLLAIEKVLILRSVKIFSAVPEDQLVDIAMVVETIEYDAGELVLRQGELETSTYIVAQGKVRFFNGENDLGVLGPRSVFGELAALDPEPRSVSVAAIEDCTLLRISGETLYELMAGNREVTRGIMKVLCEYARKNLALSRSTGGRP